MGLLRSNRFSQSTQASSGNLPDKLARAGELRGHGNGEAVAAMARLSLVVKGASRGGRVGGLGFVIEGQGGLIRRWMARDARHDPHLEHGRRARAVRAPWPLFYQRKEMASSGRARMPCSSKGPVAQCP